MGHGFAGVRGLFRKGFLDWVSVMGSGPCERVRRSHPVQPSNIGGKAFAGKQGHGLVKRQTDDRGIRPNEFLGESAGKTLDRIASSLAAPLTRSEIGFDLGCRQAA